MYFLANTLFLLLFFCSVGARLYFYVPPLKCDIRGTNNAIIFCTTSHLSSLVEENKLLGSGTQWKQKIKQHTIKAIEQSHPVNTFVEGDKASW